MATSPVKQGPGYRAFIAHLDTLRTAITEPGHLATQLYAQGLLSSLVHQRANLASLAPLERSQELLSALDGRIASDEGAFDKFLSVLNEDPVMEELCGKLRESRDVFLTTYSVKTPPPSPLELYISYLKDVYKSDLFPTYDKWPRVEGKKFINLSLLSKHKISPQETHQYVRAMSGGRIHSIAPKRKAKMADIARTEDGCIIKGKRRCILVEGAPGVGKSTFTWKLCRKWSKSKILQQYKVVVLLRLRERRVRETQKTSDLFRRCQPAAIEEISQSGGEGVLLVLDGWDELPAELHEESYFLDLVQGQELPDATILVTSRPHGSEVIVTECQDRIFQRFEIMGFTQDNVLAYMKSNAGDDAELLHSLQTYTSCYPHIRSMMYNPLNAAIVVEVYKNSWKEESTIPKTMTELYSSLIRTLLLRYLGEHPVYCKRKWSRRLREFSDLPPDVYQQLCRISKVAYEGVRNKQQVIFSDLPSDFDSLGLMQCVPELYVDEGAALSYNFLHLTVQEFLAAFHMSQQPVEKQLEIFALHQRTKGYAMVLRFIAGLTGFNDFSSVSLRTLLIEEHGYINKLSVPLHCLHFLFERKESTKVLDSIISTVDFYDNAVMSPFDYYVLGYVVSHSSCTWTVALNWDSLPCKGVEMFAKGTMKDEALCPTVANISIFFQYASFQTEGLRELLSAHPLFLTRIICLDFNVNNLDPHSCSILSQSLPSFPHLESLNLANNAIGSVTEGSTVSLHPSYASQSNSLSTMFSSPHSSIPAVQLINLLQGHNILKSLCLHNTEIGLPECAALAQWLSSPTCSLEELYIGENYLSSNETEMIITKLFQNCTLREFDVSNSQVMSQFFTRMLHLPLVQLHIRSCHIDPEMACEIARFMFNNTTLEELSLSNNPVEDEGARALADMLLHNRTLKTLDLAGISLTEQGIQALLWSLQHNSTLSKLILSKEHTVKTNEDRVEWQ